MSAESVPLPADPRAAGPAEAYLDAAAVGSQLLARGRQPGDRIEPVGMAGSRKLQDIMVDRKIPRQERDRLPVVLDNAGCILWAARCCVSRAAALNPHSQSAVRISWTGGQGMTPSTQDNEETGATRHDE